MDTSLPSDYKTSWSGFTWESNERRLVPFIAAIKEDLNENNKIIIGDSAVLLIDYLCYSLDLSIDWIQNELFFLDNFQFILFENNDLCEKVLSSCILVIETIPFKGNEKLFILIISILVKITSCSNHHNDELERIVGVYYRLFEENIFCHSYYPQMTYSLTNLLELPQFSKLFVGNMNEIVYDNYILSLLDNDIQVMKEQILLIVKVFPYFPSIRFIVALFEKFIEMHQNVDLIVEILANASILTIRFFFSTFIYCSLYESETIMEIDIKNIQNMRNLVKILYIFPNFNGEINVSLIMKSILRNFFQYDQYYDKKLFKSILKLISAPEELMYIYKYGLRLDFKKKSVSDIIILTLPIIKEMNSLKRTEIIVFNQLFVKFISKYELLFYIFDYLEDHIFTIKRNIKMLIISSTSNEQE